MKRGTYWSYLQGKCMCGCDDLDLCTICGERLYSWQADDDGDHAKCVAQMTAEERENKNEI